MKNNIIRLPEVDAVMLMEVQKRNKVFRDVEKLVSEQIRNEFGNLYQRR